MVLKLAGWYGSIATRRAAAVLKEKNVPYEFIHIDMWKKEQGQPEHLEKQPFCQVPYIDDDGFILYESRAIGRYIAAKYRDQGSPLVPDPTDLKATALFEQAASVELSDFDPYASGIAYQKVFFPKRGVPTNEEVLKSHLANLSAKLAVYDTILAKQKYIAGDEFTLVDIFHLPWGTMLGTMGYDILESGEYPNVTRWWKDITSRPSWQAVKTSAAPQ